MIELLKPDRRPCCPTCGSQQIIVRRSVNHHEILRCRRCRLSFVWPLPSPRELSEFYNDTYFERYCGVGYETLEPSLTAEFERKLDLLDRQKYQRGALLEIGCGLGYFLRAARNRGWIAEGVEPSPEIAVRAGEHSGAPVHCGSIENVRLKDQSFDAVVLWATIEHLAEPQHALIEAYRLLKPGGVLNLDTGLVDDLAGYLEPGYSAWFYPPEHLFFFTRKAMRTILAFAGFVDVRISTNLWLPRWRFALHRGAQTARQLLKIARGPKRFVVARSSQRAKYGTMMYVYARRPTNGG